MFMVPQQCVDRARPFQTECAVQLTPCSWPASILPRSACSSRDCTSFPFPTANSAYVQHFELIELPIVLWSATLTPPAPCSLAAVSLRRFLMSAARL